jgi:nucleoside-diphosphate-sugar epimerase
MAAQAMNIFITGASGFVGGAAARRLSAEGHRIRAMSLSGSSDQKIRAMGAEPVRCDLEMVAAADVRGAEIVIHCAAFVEQWGPPDAWDRINVEGTRRMLDAAQQAGARRFIHIGTEAALVRGQHLRGVDETYPLAFDSPYPYCRTKALAEQAVCDASRAGFETIVLRPRFIWGPGDQTILPLLQKMAAGGGWMWIDHGRAVTSTTHIENLVDAIELALTKGQPGKAYFILDDSERSMEAMLSGLAASVGVVLSDRSIPYWLADTIAAMSEGVWRLLRLSGDPPLTRHAAMVMARDCILIGTKAKNELGYRARVTVEEGLAALRDETKP